MRPYYLTALATLLTLQLLIFPITTLGKLKVGEKPTLLQLTGKNGGLVSGGDWDSGMIHGKIWAVFYIDPDESELNEAAISALKEQQFPRDRYGSIAVINMDATWLPNMAIESKLEEKQKTFPDTIYVKDFRKVLVKQWGLGDNTYVVLIFGKEGQLLFRQDGKLETADTEKMLAVIRQNL